MISYAVRDSVASRWAGLGFFRLLRRSLPDDARRAWLVQARSGQLVYRAYDWRLNTAVR